MSRPRLLDLFCCEGGAGEGYRRAGFDVYGVDIVKRPRNPHPTAKADALKFLDRWWHRFDAVHASPPCHDHSSLAHLTGNDGTGDLLTLTLKALAPLPIPWVVENVEGAAPLMPDALTLCGTEFGLKITDRKGLTRWLKRHRLFASNVLLMGAGGCSCGGRPVIGVYGHGGGDRRPGRAYKADVTEARAIMGMPWASRKGVSQAIPPAYTQFIGEQLMAAL
jgi:DNA (cytosine-5)-methyltransferase 1